jgi:probable HAF family extracellular repeat protein
MKGKFVMTSRLAACFIIGLMASKLSSEAQSYNIRDLGAVGSDSTSQGYGLNGSGEAVGTSSGGTAMATLFSNGKAIGLDPNTSDVSIAAAISNSGEVAGSYYNSRVGTPFHAFVVSGGTFLDIHSPSLFPQGTQAKAVNSSGEVVGIGQIDSWSFHVFGYSNGQMVDLGPPGSFQAQPSAINDAGQIVGNYYTSSTDNGPFLYSNGKFTNLGAPAGTTTSAAAINSTGQIVGTIIFNSGAPEHAALYSNGVWTDLGGYPGATGTSASGINSAGQIIGVAGFKVTSYHPFIPARTIALLVRNGGLVDLDTLIPANSGFTLTRTIAINDSGEILCNAKNSAGHQRAVLLTPE